MKEVNNDKRVLQVEIDNNVKKVDITGVDADDNVVMKQELNEDDLDQAAGGFGGRPFLCRDKAGCSFV
jgi:hypothetical protein